MATPENKSNKPKTNEFRRTAYYPDLPELRIAEPWTLTVFERRRLHLFAKDIAQQGQPFAQMRLIRKNIPHTLQIDPASFDMLTLQAAYALSDRHFESEFDGSERSILNARAGKWSLRQLGKSLLKVSGGEIVDAYFDEPDTAALTVTGYNWKINREIALTIVEMSKFAKIPRDVIPYTQATVTFARMTAREAERHKILLRDIRSVLRKDSSVREDPEDYEGIARAVVRAPF
jgi:hypothetical protein